MKCCRPQRRRRKPRIHSPVSQAIRRDVGNGMSGRTIERKHHVGRRTIIKALASADPPPRKKTQR
jgi:hypothetical protein